MREFETGATRDDDTEKLDIEGFLNPVVVKRYCEYLHKHQKQADGKLRNSDNWQKGMPKKTYVKSLLRHVLDVWLEHRGYNQSEDGIQDALCATIFNAMGYLFEILDDRDRSSYAGTEKIVHTDTGSIVVAEYPRDRKD